MKITRSLKVSANQPTTDMSSPRIETRLFLRGIIIQDATPCTIWYKDTSVSKEPIAPIFRVDE
jgi:hypothetical protein